MTSRSLLKKISAIPDWKTRRRIVVIESDDWGSLRMPSMNAFKKLEELKKNRGKLYHPDVVDACLALFEEDHFEFDDVNGADNRIDGFFS